MTRTFLRSALCLGAAAGVLAACTSKTDFDPTTQMGANPVLPAPKQYLLPPMHIAKVAHWGDGQAAPAVLAGLTIQPMATGLQHPRQVYALPNGDVLAVESSGPPAPTTRPKEIVMRWVQGQAGAGAKGANRITLLRDTNGDGIADQRSVLIDGLNSPFGVVLVGDQLYVAATDALLRYPLHPGETKITAAPVKVTDLPGGPIDHHWTKSLTASPDGKKLYVGVGSNSNITENGIEAEKERAAVWEVDAATGAHRLYATGVRNPTGVAFEPVSKQLWAVANERDELGPDLVPDYLTSLKDGGFYGWPYSYYGQHIDPRVKPQRPDLVAQAIPPSYALSSHVAPLGLTFFGGGSLGARFAGGGAFIGEHGSWDRNPFNGYKVVFVPFANGRPSGKPIDVVTGFIGSDDKARGRPVGVTIARDGALIVADDLGNTVWRVSAARNVAAAHGKMSRSS